MDTKEIKELGHIKRVGLNAQQRKEYHIWASEHKYLHLSYVDKKYDRELVTEYYCLKCKKWQHEDRCIYRPCCTNENGDQCCSGPSIWICPDCRYYNNEDMSPVIVWQSGESSLHIYKYRMHQGKNAILICTDTNLNSESNKHLFQDCGLTMRNIKRQLRRFLSKR